MLFFSKTPKKAIPGYFILITLLILQKYQIGFVNGRITLVVLLNSFTHTLWLKRHQERKEIFPNAYVLFQILCVLGMLMVL
jgi:membrane-associated HD superfamily phosphohydrolase